MAVTADQLAARAEHFTWWYGSRVSPQWRYVCVTTGKVACSTVKYALHDLEGKPPVEGWWTVHDGDDEMSMSRFGTETVAEMLNDASVLTFCFVRNPYDRLFSAWKSKVLRRMDTQFHEFRERMRDHYGYPAADGDAPRATVAFGDFARYIVDVPDDPSSNDGHWCSQVESLWWDLIPYDVVGRFENFDADFAAVLDRLGAPDTARSRATERFNETTPIPMSAGYDSALAALVYEHYRADFETFGYSKDSWRRYDSLLPT